GSISTSGGRQRFSESGGYITLTSTGSDPTLRVPIHIAARPASTMSTVEARLQLPAAATGTFDLNPVGTPVDTADDASLVSILELKNKDPNEPTSSGITDNADLQYIGATSDYPVYPFADATMYFGIVTYGKWDTANSVEFDVYIDVNEDGTDDYVIFNVNQGFFTSVTDDVMITAICNLSTNLCGADYYTNLFSGGTNTNLFNNNVMVLPVALTSIGLADGANTDFNFYVVSYSREAAGAVDTTNIMSYDVAHQSFITVDTVVTGAPTWLDIPGSPFTITYDKANITDNSSMGLLLLHHHNAAVTAQVLDFQYRALLPLIAR
ncbi:MAG: hypothetical protein ACM3H7_04920, partial [Acidobacteriaceae bacterium]